MGVRISDDLKERIVHWYYQDDMTMEEIRDLAHCSLGLISKVINNYREFGQVRVPFTQWMGRPSTLTDGDLTFLKAILEANPGLYLDEMQEKLAAVRDVHASIATISRTLEHIRMSKKTVTKAAMERDNDVRMAWETMMAEYQDPDLFVALDESAVDNRTVQRLDGWAPVGQQCVRRMSFLRGERYSILPALTIDGIIALEIVKGSITKERFLSFLQEQVVCASFMSLDRSL